jgi:transposase
MKIRGLLLTRDEREMLTQERDLARKNKIQEVDLKVTCILLAADGIPQRDISEMLGVSLRTLESWIEKFRSSGLRSLIKGPYPGKKSRLTGEDKEELARIVTEGPEKAGLDTGVWTARIVVALIKNSYGVSYCVSQIHRILHWLNMSVQVPDRRSSKADPGRQKEWIEKELPAIIEKVLAERGVLIYEDEASFQQSGSIHRTWAPKGQRFIVMSFPGRKSVKALGAVKVDETPKWHFRFAEKFNGESFIALLEQLLRQYKGRKIHFITDNVRYHKSLKVKKWLQGKEDKIEIHYLPPYSPQFNAVEYVWKKLKSLTTHNRFFATLAELHSKIFRRFNRFQGNPASLRSTIAGFT